MKVSVNKFIFKRCTSENISDILNIQDEAFKDISNPDILKNNSPEMLLTCLSDPHYTLGAFYNNKLVGFAILYIGGISDENLGRSIGASEESLLFIANMKLCIVLPEFRGNNLQYILFKKLENIAKQFGYKMLCTTVSPDNVHGYYNIETLGYKLHSCIKECDGFIHCVYYKYI